MRPSLVTYREKRGSVFTSYLLLLLSSLRELEVLKHFRIVHSCFSVVLPQHFLRSISTRYYGF